MPHLEVRVKPKTFQDRCLGLWGQPNPFDRRLTASQPVELRSILGKQTSPQVIRRLPTNQSLFEQRLLLEDVSRSSLELSLENAKIKETAGTYIQAFANLLKNKKDVIGYAFAINGQVNSADVYASSVLFAKLWPKLLKASAVEAIAELEENAKPTSVQESAVTAFLVGPDKAASEKDVTQRVRLLTRENDDSIFFETRDRQKKDAWIHRNYIKK